MTAWFQANEVFRIMDVPVRLHRSIWWFVPLLLLFGLDHWPLLLTLIPLCLLSTLAHELGHVILARHHDCGVRDIIIAPPLGGMARLELAQASTDAKEQVFLAGPLVNLGLALLGFGLWFAGLTFALAPLRWLGLTFGGINTLYAFGNLLPLYPLDGGRIVKARLEQKHNVRIAMDKLGKMGAAAGIALAAIAVFSAQIWLFLLALFFWLSPKIERTREEFTGQAQASVDATDWEVGPAPYEQPAAAPPGFAARTLHSIRILITTFARMRLR